MSKNSSLLASEILRKENRRLVIGESAANTFAMENYSESSEPTIPPSPSKRAIRFAS